MDRDEEFTWFFKAEYEPVVRTVFLIVRDSHRAEELAQEAFSVLYERWRRVSRYERPDAWVRKVAIRLALRASRRDRMRGVLERRTADHRSHSAAEPESELTAAIGSLSPSQRVATILFYFEDRPLSEIGDVLGCSEATARVHLHRARQRLRLALGEEAINAT